MSDAVGFALFVRKFSRPHLQDVIEQLRKLAEEVKEFVEARNAYSRGCTSLSVRRIYQRLTASIKKGHFYRRFYPMTRID